MRKLSGHFSFEHRRLAACCATGKPPNALIAIACSNSAGTRSTKVPRARALTFI